MQFVRRWKNTRRRIKFTNVGRRNTAQSGIERNLLMRIIA
jgi:hypothetical protein